MRFKAGSLILGFLFLLGCNTEKPDETIPLEKVINEALNFSLNQSLLMAESLENQPGKLPKSLTPEGKLETCNSDWWVSGFFPGTLWYLYEYSKDERVKKQAINFSQRVEQEQYTTNNHDVGFIIFCSYGNGYRITPNDDYARVINTTANSLSTRYNPKIGCIRSWDRASWNSQWQYPVIIDNMMNLELLTWSSKKFNEPKFMEIAVSHANRTMSDFYRDDYSCYHVVSYDTITGRIEKKNTSQGHSDESAWSRGQAWGLYGFTMMYRETGDQKYLDFALKIASFLITHPRMPEDFIPWWDFDYPGIPNTCRDVSAGAIMCSALIELSQYTGEKEKALFLEVAEIQLRALSSPRYRNQPGTAENFILNHSVGHFPNQTEVDVPLSYADYYYVEALMRMREVCRKKKN